MPASASGTMEDNGEAGGTGAHDTTYDCGLGVFISRVRLHPFLMCVFTLLCCVMTVSLHDCRGQFDTTADSERTRLRMPLRTWLVYFCIQARYCLVSYIRHLQRTLAPRPSAGA